MLGWVGLELWSVLGGKNECRLVEQLSRIHEEIEVHRVVYIELTLYLCLLFVEFTRVVNRLGN